MAVYLLLIFLSLVTTTIQLPGSGIFLIHNEDHKLCVKAQSSNSVIIATCNQDDESQKFRWVSDHQILSMALKSCLGVPSMKDQAVITLYPCNKTSKLQQWECRNETLLAIQGEDLFFNSAHGEGRKVMLSKGSGSWNRWKIYGTTKNLCSQGYEDMFTLLGNAFGAPCVFPFKFNSTWYAECTKDRKAGNEQGFPWCATSTDFDEDSLFGYCPLKDNIDKDFWTTNPFTGTHYQINSNSALTWHQARKSCQQQNAELLSITELHEQTYLTALTGRGNSELWIGLNRLNSNGGWQWIGGSPFRYLNWAPGSPSLESEKICGLLQSGNGKWENQQCDQKLGYICKKGNSSLDSFIIPSGDFRPIKCPSGWIPYSGHCYMIYRAPKIWKGALSSCRKVGGDLASIHNIEEYSFTVSQLGYKPTDELWIGLNDLKIQMYFEWSDGTPVTYTKWLHEEPSHANNRKEDCVSMKGEDGYWADDVCEKKLGYICKMKPLAEESEEVEVIVPGCQKGWIRHGFYCYSVGQTSVTFSEAKKICEGNKGYLVTVKDRYEQAFLTVLIGFSPVKYFWIALSDVEEQGTFKWADGEAVLFTHWNSGMPGREPGCVAMRTGTTAGLWDVVNCEEKSMFLCKQLVEGVTPPPVPTTTPAPSCPDGWHSSAHSSSCLKHFQNGRKHMKTWFDARDFCRAIGGDLASIHSEEDQNVINSLDRAHYYQSYWMGLSAFDPDRGFTWSDGSPVNYENWADGEPNNYDGNEKCAMFNGYTDMQWNDMFCETLGDWVCQIKKGATLKPEPSTTFEYTYKVSEDGWVIYEDKAYYFSHETLPMEKAREYCKKNSGDLVIIEGESERKFLWRYSFYYDFGDCLYIGLSVSLDKKFSWIDGTPINYVAWAPNEPNFSNNEENCVVMYTRTGMWNDLNCGAPNGFICERLNNTTHSIVVPTSLAPLGGCPQNWFLFNNKCFKIFGSSENERLTWHAARTACINLEGNLASIPSEEVQAFLITHFKDASTDTWIGLNDVNSEYTFLWTDGSGVYYTNWANGFPNYRSQADCVVMIKDPIEEAGKWKDVDCQMNKSYICQRNTDPKLYNFQTTVPVSGFTLYGNSSYSLISSRMNWEEARKNCKAEYSELASILDPYSQSFLWLQVLKVGQPVWIGLNSNVTSGFYKWTDNWRIKYSKWASEEPKQNLACVYLDVDGTWKTGSCDENYLSVCKRSDVVVPTEPPQLPGKCPTSDIRRSWIPFHDHCYYIESSETESWPQSSMECVRLGASLVSIENRAEMNFLLHHLDAFASDARQFWIGMYKNVDGEWTWADNSAVEFVNWKKREPTDGYHEHCVDMDASDGGWRSYYCSADKRFICKIPKIAEVEPSEKPSNNKVLKTDEAVPAHRLSGMAVILVLLILVGAGLAAYFFYKKKRHNQLPTDVSFDNTLYCNRDAVPAASDSKYLVANIEQNEQAML